jgi:hypothetical protein
MSTSSRREPQQAFPSTLASTADGQRNRPMPSRRPAVGPVEVLVVRLRELRQLEVLVVRLRELRQLAGWKTGLASRLSGLVLPQS